MVKEKNQKKLLKHGIVSGLLIGSLLLQGCGVGGRGLASTSSMEKPAPKDILASRHAGGFIGEQNLFTEGLLSVRIQNEVGDVKWGYINEKGDMVIEAKFYEAYPFQNGYGYVCENNQRSYYYIDGKGNRYDDLEMYAKMWGRDFVAPKRMYDNADGRGCYFAEDGERSEENKAYQVYGVLSKNLMKIRYKEEESYAILDSRGEWRTPFDFQDILPFHIKSKLALASEDGEHYGLIDEYGRFVVENRFFVSDLISWKFVSRWPPISDSFLQHDLFPVAEEKEGPIGYIDEKGKFKIPPVYDYAEPFCKEGLALVRQGEEYFFINTKGKKAFDRTFRKEEKEIYEGCESVTPYINGMAAFEEDGKIGFMDTTGKTVISPQFDSTIGSWGGYQMLTFYTTGHRSSHYAFKDDGYATVVKDGKFGVIDRRGRFVIPPKFDDIDAW